MKMSRRMRCVDSSTTRLSEGEIYIVYKERKTGMGNTVYYIEGMPEGYKHLARRFVDEDTSGGKLVRATAPNDYGLTAGALYTVSNSYFAHGGAVYSLDGMPHRKLGYPDYLFVDEEDVEDIFNWST
jgi:hypothetical protein